MRESSPPEKLYKDLILPSPIFRRLRLQWENLGELKALWIRHRFLCMKISLIINRSIFFQKRDGRRLLESTGTTGLFYRRAIPLPPRKLCRQEWKRKILFLTKTEDFSGTGGNILKILMTSGMR